MLSAARNYAVSLILLAAVAACAQHISSPRASAHRTTEKHLNAPLHVTPSPTPFNPVPVPTQSSKPIALASAAPTPAWHEAVAASAVPTTALVAHTVIPTLSPDAPPRIVGIHLASTVVTPGQTVVGSVTASSNVASVELRIGGYSSTMQKVGVGRFTLAFIVPDLPSFLLGRTYELDIIARNTRGDSVDRQLPITVQ